MANSNPLGPEIICNALNDALEPLDIDIRSKLVFFKLIDRYMIDGMGVLLKSGNEMLREMGVCLILIKNIQYAVLKLKMLLLEDP